MSCQAHQYSGKPCRKSTSGPVPASTTWNRLPLAPTNRWVHGPSTSTHDSSTWALMTDSLGATRTAPRSAAQETLICMVVPLCFRIVTLTPTAGSFTPQAAAGPS